MIKKWTKILVLLGIKESYLFSKNSLGLAVHPFKTLRSLQREKDRSQQLLFLIWPVLMLGIALYLQGKAGQGLVVVGWALLGVSLFLFGYLGYWMMKVWRVNKYE
ncbi:MAG: hypothetical protein ABII08_03690 [Candidatus Beckwithbacteria bacterium]